MRNFFKKSNTENSAGGWRLAAGGWRLAAGGWRLAAGGWRLAAGGWRLAAGGLVLAALSACGGGVGGGESNSAITTDAPTTVLQSSVVTVDTAQARQLISVSTTPTGASQIKFSPGSSVAASLTTGAVLSISQDSDTRFPLGLAGKVTSVSSTSGGEKIVTLSRVALADVISQSNVQANDIPLTSDNFIGVISPQAVQAGTTGVVAVSGFQNAKSVLGGGIILQDKPSGFLKDVAAQASTFLGGNGTVDAGEIKLNLQIKLADMVQDASRLKPYGGGAEAKVTVNGSLKNLKITESHEFGTTIGVPTNLKSMNFKIVGDMSAEAKISGGFVAELGYFSKAWAEVDQATLNLLGVTAQLSGLDSKDKQGKYPIAGLVFSVACPTTCPVAPGTTQTPVRAAKMGGVIVWIYLNANGTLTAEGSIGVRINPGELSLGMQMPEGGKLSGIGDFKNKGTGLLLEAPFFEGKADLTARAGIAVDADFFAFGVRVGNAELFLGSQFNGSVTTTPSISYGATSLSAPWSWTGNACTSATVGGGAVLSARSNIGALVSTDWGIASGTASYTSPEYGGQWPSESELTVQGWHQVLGLNSWYTAAPSNQCYPMVSTTFQVNPISFQQINSDQVVGDSVFYSSGLVLYMPTSTAYDNATVQGVGTESQPNGVVVLQDIGGPSLQILRSDGVAKGEVLLLGNISAGYIPKRTNYTIKLYKGTALVSTQTVSLASAVIAPADLPSFALAFPMIGLRSYAALCPNDVATTATGWFTIPSSSPKSPQASISCPIGGLAQAAVEYGDVNNYRFKSYVYAPKF
jgi:hypothetical protein